MSEQIFTVIDNQGVNLFQIDYVPPIGSTLRYTVDWAGIEESEFTEDTLELWRAIDGREFVVKNVVGEVRNYFGKEKVVHFVEVEPLSEA